MLENRAKSMRAVGEGSAHLDFQEVGNHESETSQYCVDNVQCWSQEHEGEFDRLGNTGQHGSQSCGYHDATNALLLLGFGRVPHSDSCSRQTEHLEQEAASQEACSRVTSEETWDVAS